MMKNGLFRITSFENVFNLYEKIENYFWDNPILFRQSYSLSFCNCLSKNPTIKLTHTIYLKFILDYVLNIFDLLISKI